MDDTSVLMKFNDLFEIEKYIQAHLEYRIDYKLISKFSSLK